MNLDWFANYERDAKEDAPIIIFQASTSAFLQGALRDNIEDVVTRQFRSATRRSVGPSETQPWKHSLLGMAKVLQDEETPADAGVATEYQAWSYAAYLKDFNGSDGQPGLLQLQAMLIVTVNSTS